MEGNIMVPIGIAMSWDHYGDARKLAGLLFDIHDAAQIKSVHTSNFFSNENAVEGYLLFF